MIRSLQLSKKETLDKYFSWLCSIVDVQDYRCLGDKLHKKTFYWFIPNDDNRSFEGRNLREKFCEEVGIEYVFDYFDFECSMFELIISMSYRCRDILLDIGHDLTVAEWFWIMIDNIGLTDCTDKYMDNFDVIDFVDKKLNIIIDRAYHKSGSGGLFPLKKAKKDQRNVELWYQMNAYLVENFYNDDINV